MQIQSARRLLATIPEDALVLDVGGGAAPFPRADWVIDVSPFDSQGGGSHGDIHRQLGDVPRRFSAETWVSWDLCSREPWPFRDKQFDFVICSHLLEDIRDPIWACSELNRVAGAGYIEVPSRILEQSRGVENPRHCGYDHHRWLVSRVGDRLVFRMKPHCLHSFRDAWVVRLKPWQQINDRYEVLAVDWQGRIEAHEEIELSEEKVIDELCDFARASRTLPDLVTPRPLSRMSRLEAGWYHLRLARGRR